MIKLIIVDDEELSLNAMARFISHIRNDVTVSGLFNNMTDAIRFLEENPVDIVITDIKMPVGSGIDLAKHVRETAPATRIIFVSAYRDFEYAQQAIALGIDQYLVKPVDVNDLSQMLVKIIESINKDRLESLQSQKEADRYNNLLLWAKTDLYVDLLSGLLTDEEEISQRAEHISLTPAQQEACHAVIMLRCGNEIPTAYGKGEYYHLILNLMREFKCVEDFVVLLKKDRDITLVLRFSPELTEDSAKLRLKHEYEKLRSFSEANLSVSLEMELAYFCNSLSELKKYKETINNSQLLQMKYRDLTSALFAGEPSKVKEIFASIALYAQTLSFTQAKTLMSELFASIRKSFELSDMNADIVFDIQATLHSSDITSLSDKCEQMLEKIIEFQRLSSIGLETLTIEKAKEYIHNHYMRDVTLEDVANHVNLSSFYFSKFFKSETGKTLTEYITSVRISKAIEMFKARKYKLYEISEMCGYKSRKYFSHAFKQYTGYTPSEYQRIMSNSTEE